MAIQKHRALIARVNNFHTLRQYPQILQSSGGGLHSPSILEQCQISNNYLTRERHQKR